MYNTYLL